MALLPLSDRRGWSDGRRELDDRLLEDLDGVASAFGDQKSPVAGTSILI